MNKTEIFELLNDQQMGSFGEYLAMHYYFLKYCAGECELYEDARLLGIRADIKVGERIIDIKSHRKYKGEHLLNKKYSANFQVPRWPNQARVENHYEYEQIYFFQDFITFYGDSKVGHSPKELNKWSWQEAEPIFNDWNNKNRITSKLSAKNTFTDAIKKQLKKLNGIRSIVRGPHSKVDNPSEYWKYPDNIYPSDVLLKKCNYTVFIQHNNIEIQHVIGIPHIKAIFDSLVDNEIQGRYASKPKRPINVINIIENRNQYYFGTMDFDDLDKIELKLKHRFRNFA